MGNHALARAIIESGTRVITSYPGSPTPEIGAALEAVPKEQRNYYFEYSANEKVALEIAAGASLNGHLSCVFFKSVGLNVASDSLIQQSLMNQVGGLVIILGDDPGANSSQNEQDNRHFSRMSYIPMLEPANPQEAYQMYLQAATLSVQYQAPIFLRLTTHVCHARQYVTFGSLRESPYTWQSKYDKKQGPYFPVTEQLFPLKENALEKLHKFEVHSNDAAQTIAVGAKNSARGVISAGLPCLSAIEVCEEIKLDADILKLGMTFPLPTAAIVDFLSTHKEVWVIEELDRVLEHEIKSIAYDHKLQTVIHSRKGSSELLGELHRDRIVALFRSTWPGPVLQKPHDGKFFDAPSTTLPQAPFSFAQRQPQLCPGCGHRSAFFAAKGVLRETDIVVGDIGCLTLGALPPYQLGEILFSMGHSVATAAGMALHNADRNVMALMGDGTFFHGGIPGVINAAAQNSNITLYLLDNATTAMTGHQPRPGNGQIGDKIDIATLLRTLGVQFVEQADAYDQNKLKQLLRESFSYNGFAVVIAKHPCMLQLTRANKKRNPSFKLPPVKLEGKLCDKQLTCISQFGCPSFERKENGQIGVNADLCIGCGSCIPVCPSGALKRGTPSPRHDAVQLKISNKRGGLDDN